MDGVRIISFIAMKTLSLIMFIPDLRFILASFMILRLITEK